MKKIISLILVLVMLFALAGCKEEPTTSSSSKESTNSENDTSGNESADEPTTSTVTSTISSGVKVETRPKDEETEGETEIKPEFTLDGDITVRDELKFGKYKLVWSDEFNGTKLDTKVWKISRPEATPADVYSTMDQVKFTGKTMLCTAQRYYDPSNSTIKFIESPAFETGDTMNYQYGYLEMRARLPYTQGTWPSFWTVSDGSLAADINKNIGNFDAEVDIYEIFGSYDTATPNIHKWGETHTQCNTIRNVYKFDDITHLRDEFHTYGYLWTKDEISMFIDGKKYQTFDLNFNYDGDKKTGMTGFHRWQYIILGTNCINSELNPGTDNTDRKADMSTTPSDFPFETEIDWIRLYQIPEEGGILTAK